jgi:hypothetical protein
MCLMHLEQIQGEFILQYHLTKVRHNGCVLGVRVQGGTRITFSPYVGYVFISSTQGFFLYLSRMQFGR